MMSKRDIIYQKYDGLCAYSGTPLEDDWQIDHVVPKCKGGTDNIENLIPVQKILNHYKRSLGIEDFRKLWLGGLHMRIGKLPKNPRTENGKHKKEYMLKIASYFGIDENTSFDGVFYFEKLSTEEVIDE
jgi:hypothetical protein